LDVWFPAGVPRRGDHALSVPGLRVGYLAFQTEKEPFARKPLRQAVAAALDPAVLAVTLGRAAVPLQSFLPPGVWARREGGPVLGGTRAQVRSLLLQGNWPKGATAAMLASSEPSVVNVPKLAEAIGLMLGAAVRWIPIYVRLVWAVTRPEVRNLRLHPTGLHRLNTVTLEPGS